MWIAWRDTSLSVRHKRSTWSSCASKHSLRATSSSRLELSPSSYLPTLDTLLDSRVRCSCRSGCGSGAVVFHCMTLKLQKTAPIDLVGGSPESSLTVHVRQIRRPPAVLILCPTSIIFQFFPGQLCISFATLCCGANSASVSDFWSPVGISEAVFTFPPPSLDLDSPAF